MKVKNLKNWEVKPIDSFVGLYKGYRKIILTEVLNGPGTDAEKLELFEKKMKTLEKKFNGERTKEYESKTTKVSVSKSCTSQSGSRDCGYAYKKAPDAGLYTTYNWITIVGHQNGIHPPAGHAGDSTIGLRQKVTGNGRKTGTATGVFRWHPSVIKKRVEDDTEYLFTKIAENELKR